MAQLHASIEKKRKGDTFWHQFNEKPSNIPGCVCKHSFVPAGLRKQDYSSFDPVVLFLAESNRLWPVECIGICAEECIGICAEECIVVCAEGAAYLTLHRGGLHWLRLKPLAIVQRILTAGLQRTGSTVGAHLATKHLQVQARSPLYSQCDTPKH